MSVTTWYLFNIRKKQILGSALKKDKDQRLHKQIIMVLQNVKLLEIISGQRLYNTSFCS